MNIRRFTAEMTALVACAALCAFVSNLLAGRERKLSVVGKYENALVVSRTQGPRPGDEPNPTAKQPESAAAELGSKDVPAPTLPSVVTSRSAANPGAALRSTPTTLMGSKATPAPPQSLLARFPPHPDRPYVEISGTDAEWAHQQGVRFLDARRTSVFAEGHVAGALSFPVWESDVDQKIFGFQDQVQRKDDPVVLYCSGGECEDSHLLAERLFAAGFTNLIVYRDGWPDWQKRGAPVRIGLEP